MLDHSRWYRIKILNGSDNTHLEINQQLGRMGYTVLSHHRAKITWVTSRDPLDELMLPLKLSGCQVEWYENMTAALESKHHSDFDHL